MSTPVVPRDGISEDIDVAILGGGWTGILSAYHLTQQGVTNFRNIDHAGNFGGSLVSQNTKLLGSYIRLEDVALFSAGPLLVSVLGIVIVMAPRSGLYAVLVVLFSVVFIALALVLTRGVRDAGARHAAPEHLGR